MNDNDTPLVSVVMSVYNGQNYIRDAIMSICHQSYKNIEIIVIDDCSTDDSVKIIETIPDSRVILLKNDRNRRLAYNLNKGIAHSNGKYIMRMDADDICPPDRVEKQVLFMEKNTNVDVLGGNYQAIGDMTFTSNYQIEHQDIKTALLFENAICHPAVMFRKKSISEWYNPDVLAGQDYELWSRLIQNHIFHNMPDVILKYRKHKGQTRKVLSKEQKRGATIARNRLLNETQLSLKELESYNAFCNIEDDLSMLQFTTAISVSIKVGKSYTWINQKVFYQLLDDYIWRNILNDTNKLKRIKKIIWVMRNYKAGIILDLKNDIKMIIR